MVRPPPLPLRPAVLIRRLEDRVPAGSIGIGPPIQAAPVSKPVAGETVDGKTRNAFNEGRAKEDCNRLAREMRRNAFVSLGENASGVQIEFMEKGQQREIISAMSWMDMRPILRSVKKK